MYDILNINFSDEKQKEHNKSLKNKLKRCLKSWHRHVTKIFKYAYFSAHYMTALYATWSFVFNILIARAGQGMRDIFSYSLTLLASHLFCLLSLPFDNEESIFFGFSMSHKL